MCDDGNYRESRWFTAWTRSRTLEEFILPRIITEVTGQTQVPITSCLSPHTVPPRPGADR